MGKRPQKPDKTVAVRLSTELHRRAKVYAASAGATLQDVFREALAEYLKRKSA